MAMFWLVRAGWDVKRRDAAADAAAAASSSSPSSLSTGVVSHAVADDAAADDASPTVASPAAAAADDAQARPPPRKSRSRAPRLLPTHHEEAEPKESPAAGRSSPSSFARERMRQIAANNAPFDDPDRQRPQWRRVFSKAFPGFT
ncbi:hypothetical protein CDD83_5859 [Cordyceps sp. RAO-2017]|nr:hypothetical protein CDD83_5859 [Cordyceps sp. RAO-2017]